ncbi:MAG: thioesterase family protein [Proteobacteria bacterium]|nr:thioesterase family protein [Pseudomonadota bacterium]
MTNHPFDAAIALEPQADGSFLGHTSAAYANMVGPYGGITAAQALTAVLRHPQCLGEPVALTVNYAAAVADGAFSVQARAARTNRSTQHWIVEIVQQGETVLTATVFTALRRDTWGTVEHLLPKVPAPAAIPPPQGRRPVEWINRYEMRFVEGGLPQAWDDSDSGHSRTRLWMRDDPPRPLDFASLAALADAFFPRLWRRRASRIPLGTVTMTVYFHADAAQLAQTGTGYLLGQAQGQAFRGGYFDHTAQLWNEAGELLATSQQLVYYKS